MQTNRIAVGILKLLASINGIFKNNTQIIQNFKGMWYLLRD